MRTRAPIKLKLRHPLLGPVSRFDDAIGPLVTHLRTYSKPENESVRRAAWSVLQVTFAFHMKQLRRLDPGKNAPRNKQQQFNDSVRYLKEIYTRYRERIRRGWLAKIA